MAQPVTKIYELRTLGYDELVKQLKNVDTLFDNITAAKKGLNKEKVSTQDSEQLQKINAELEQQKIKTAELRVEKQRLINETKAEQNIRQSEINQQKAKTAGNVAEANSIKDIRNQIRELNAATIVKAQGGGSPINFRGQLLSYDQAIIKLQQLTAAEQAFRRQFAADRTLVGEYTTGIIQAFKQMGLQDLVAGQVVGAKQRIDELDKELVQLRNTIIQVQQTGGTGLDNLERDLIANRTEANALRSEVNRLNTELKNTNDVGSSVTNTIKNGFASAGATLKTFVIGYIGFQAALSAGTRLTRDMSELSDQTTSLEIELDKAAGGASKLVNELAKLNTRTKLVDLENIANIAARAGVAEDKLAGVTAAIDKLKIAFGDDFGNVEEGTESLVKIINIFEGTESLNEDVFLRTGNAIRTLANESVASVPYLNDFSTRLAGLEGIAKVGLPAVLGLGSGFEQFGQSAEVSSTVLIKLIPKLATNVEQFSKYAGLTADGFAKLLESDPSEALLRFSEGIVKDKEGLIELEAAVQDSEIFGPKGGGRGAAILGVLGAQSETFRKSIDSARKSIQETGNIQDAFTKKNENFAAVIDKISKKFSDLGNNKALQNTLLALANIITFLLGNFNILIPVLLVMIGLTNTMAGAVLRLVGAYALERAAQAIEIGQVIVMNSLYAIRNIAIATYTALLSTAALGTGRLAIATRALYIAFSILSAPISIAIIAIVALTTVIGIFSSRAGAANNALEKIGRSAAEYAKQQEFAAEATREANKELANQRAETDSLIQVITKANVSLKTKQEYLDKLIAQSPEYLSGLTLQNIATDEGRQILDKYNQSLQLNAQLKAASVIKNREFDNLTNLNALKQELEIAKATQKGFGELTEDAQKLFSKITTSVGRTAFSSDLFNRSISASDFKEAFDEVNEQIEKQNIALGGANANLIKQQETVDKGRRDYLAKALLTARDMAATAKQQYGAASQEFTTANDKFLKLAEQYRNEFGKEANKPVFNSKGGVVAGPAMRTVEAIRSDLEAANEQWGKAVVGSRAKKELADKIKALNLELKAATADTETPGTTGGGTRAFRGSRFSGEQKDYLRDLEAARDEALSKLKQQRLEDNISEEQYLKQSLKINTDNINAKLAYIKGATAIERATIAQLNLEKVQNQQETNDKLFELQKEILKNTLQEQINAVKEQEANILRDPIATESEKAQAKLDADRKLLDLQIAYGKALDDLEKKLGQNTVKNQRETANEVSKLKRELLDDQLKLDQAALKDQQAAGEKSIAEFKQQIAALRLAVANSNKSPQQKATANEAIDDTEETGLLAREVANMRAQLPIYRKLLEQKKITETEYLKFMADLQQKEADLANRLSGDLEGATKRIESLADLVRNKLKGLFNFDLTTAEGRAYSELVGSAIVQTFQIADQAAEAYFQRQQARVERERQLANERIDIETNQLKARAQSQSEIESLERQAIEKKRQVDKQAFEKDKKLKLQQAKIQFGITLINLLASSSAYPFPANLIIFGVQAALASAQYAINRANIQSAQFAYGGQPDKSTTRGGKVGGRSHAQGGNPFMFKGRVFEDEVDELNIIRTKNAPKNRVFSLTGTQAQIASSLNVAGGGVEFAPGAKHFKFANGGALGEVLQAPVFNPGSTNILMSNSNNDRVLEAMTEQNESILELANEQSKRIDRLLVVQETNSVTKAQQKIVQQTEIGTF